MGAQTLTRALNRQSLKQDYFLQESIPVYYDLGYVLADGSVIDYRGKAQKLELTYHTRDEEIILGMRQRLGSNHHISRGWRKTITGKKAPFSRVQVTNTHLATSLVEHRGIPPRKSHMDLPFPEVQSEFLPHLIRGYLDGMGEFQLGKLAAPVFISWEQ